MSLRRRHAWGLNLLALLFATACTEAGTTSPGAALPSSFYASAAEAVADGETPINLTLLLRDAVGNPIVDTQVTLALTDGVATLVQPPATDSAGTTIGSVTSTQPGDVSIGAQFSYLGQIVTLPPVHITFLTQQPMQVAPNLSISFSPASGVANGNQAVVATVHVLDGVTGMPVVGAPVDVQISGSNNILSASDAQTGGDGSAAFSITSTRAEAKVVLASVGATFVTSTVTFVAGPADANHSVIIATCSTPFADGVSQAQVSVLAQDMYDNPVPSLPVTIAVSGTGYTLGASSGQTNVHGGFTTTLSATVAGPRAVQATLGGFVLSTSLDFFAPIANAATSSLVATPAQVAADGVTLAALTLTATDINGSPIANTPVLWRASGANSNVTVIDSNTNAHGVARAEISDTAAEVSVVTAIVQTISLHTNVSFYIAGQPSLANSSLSVEPQVASVNATAPISAMATVADNRGLAVPETNVVFYDFSEGDALHPKHAVTDSVGNANTIFKSMYAGLKPIYGYVDGIILSAQATFSPKPATCQGGRQSFATPPKTTGVDTISAIAVSDFDGDGTLDLAAIPVASQRIATAHGMGNGTFASFASSANTTFLPSDVIAQDIDGDGTQDLAMVSRFDSNITLAFNGPSGLSTVNEVAAVMGLSRIALADVNADNILDLVTAGHAASGNNMIAILDGQAHGTFGPLMQRIVNNPSASQATLTGMAVADFDGDYVADIALSFSSGSTPLAILWGAGNGTFTAPVWLAAPVGGVDIVAADINGDHQLDLAMAGGTANNVVTFINQGGRNFGTATTTSAGNNIVAIKTAMLNGDTMADLVAVSAQDHTLQTFLGQSNGSLSPAMVTITGPYPQRVVLADVNRDGMLDAVVWEAGVSSVSVLLGQGTGSFASQSLFMASQPAALAVFDFTGDGNRDVVVAEASGMGLGLFVNPGNGALLPAGNISAPGSVSDVVAGDFDNDGLVDVAFADATQGNVTIALNNGAHSFMPMQPNVTLPMGTFPRKLKVADFDSDGHLDIAYVDMSATTSSVAPLRILFGTGTGAFSRSSAYGSGGVPHDLAIGDINGDGVWDVLVAATGTGVINVYLGRGDGTFIAGTPISVPLAPVAVALGDMDGDGNADVIASSGTNVAVFKGAAGGALSNPTLYAAQDTVVSLVFGDANGDGVRDVFYTAASGNVGVMLGTQGTMLLPPTLYTAQAGASHVYAADMNGDGAQDILVSNSMDNSFSLLENVGCVIP